MFLPIKQKKTVCVASVIQSDCLSVTSLDAVFLLLRSWWKWGWVVVLCFGSGWALQINNNYDLAGNLRYFRDISVQGSQVRCYRAGVEPLQLFNVIAENEGRNAS